MFNFLNTKQKAVTILFIICYRPLHNFFQNIMVFYLMQNEHFIDYVEFFQIFINGVFFILINVAYFCLPKGDDKMLLIEFLLHIQNNLLYTSYFFNWIFFIFHYLLLYFFVLFEK